MVREWISAFVLSVEAVFTIPAVVHDDRNNNNAPVYRVDNFMIDSKRLDD
jgi:hypothetical protein